MKLKIQTPILPIIRTADVETSAWANRLNNELNTTVGQVVEAIDNLNAVGYYSKDPTGFANTNNDSTIAFDDATRKFTITPTDDDGIVLFKDGDKILIKETRNLIISDVEGPHYIYFDGETLELAETDSFSETLLSENIYVAEIYWDATNKKSVLIGDERHGLMPWYIHILWHQTFGTSFISGAAISLTSPADSDGSSDDHVRFSVTEAIIRDEDIKHTLTGFTAPASPKIWYKTGAALWREADGPLYLSGSSIPYYNSFSGGSWGLTEVTNTKFFLMHIFAVNDKTRNFQLIMGEAEYSSISDAREGANTEISDLILTGMPAEEFIPVATLIYQVASSYTNTYNARIRSTDTGEDFIDWRYQELTPGVTPGSHTNLTDRDAINSHPATAVSVDTTNFDYIDTSAIDVQQALDDIDDVLWALSPALPSPGTVTIDTVTSFDPTISSGYGDTVKTIYTWDSTGITDALEMRLYYRIGSDWFLLASAPVTREFITEGVWTEFDSTALTFTEVTGDCIIPSTAEEIQFRLTNPSIGAQSTWSTAAGTDTQESSYTLPAWNADRVDYQISSVTQYEEYTWPGTGSPDWSSIANKIRVEFQAQISGTWYTVYEVPWSLGSVKARITGDDAVVCDFAWPSSMTDHRIAVSYAIASDSTWDTAAVISSSTSDMSPPAGTGTCSYVSAINMWDLVEQINRESFEWTPPANASRYEAIIQWEPTNEGLGPWETFDIVPAEAGSVRYDDEMRPSAVTGVVSSAWYTTPALGLRVVMRDIVTMVTTVWPLYGGAVLSSTTPPATGSAILWDGVNLEKTNVVLDSNLDGRVDLADDSDTLDGLHASEIIGSGVLGITAADTTEQWAEILSGIYAGDDRVFRTVMFGGNTDETFWRVESLISFSGSAPVVYTTAVGDPPTAGVQIYRTATSPDVFAVWAHVDSDDFGGIRVEQVEAEAGLGFA